MAQRTEAQIMQNWKTQESPLVSVICTTYNHEPYIKDAIEGFLMQETDFAFEVIIHDDASTDKTAEIVREYAEKYPKIIKPIFQAENQYSQGKKCSVIAIGYAKGEYIALCEGDDYWTDPYKLQKQVDFLEANPNYVITYHDSQPFNEFGDMRVNYGGATRDLGSIELQKAASIYTLTTCFRNVIKPYPPEYALTRIGDVFIWSLLGKYGKGKFLGDIKPAKYRVYDGGIFSKKSKRQKQIMRLVTNCAIFAYHDRVGNKYLANYFQANILKSVLKLFGFWGTFSVLTNTRVFKKLPLSHFLWIKLFKGSDYSE